MRFARGSPGFWYASGFGLDGIRIASASNVIAGNWIGLGTDGVTAAANGGFGITLLTGADGNTIGGVGAFDRNVISGNLDGIHIDGGNANRILGNYIGTDATGTLAVGNAIDGIYIDNAGDNLIGGTAPSERNIISGNARDGVHILGPTATGNSIQGNYIGLDVSGALAIGNFDDGVDIVDGGANDSQNYPLLSSISTRPARRSPAATTTTSFRPSSRPRSQRQGSTSMASAG